MGGFSLADHVYMYIFGNGDEPGVKLELFVVCIILSNAFENVSMVMSSASVSFAVCLNIKPYTSFQK
ncbi:hypothetical protein QW060_24990 [Myroides ceti]|uniref:Uncharacterized protein n=1 Tax=Paenimyroides ceti TaxID=395087 RepID=A0ABT8D467_9FLAO|nr:hypothetical protein [Paenimyroides ceti]MDN3710137.1 hypothetical protein [Paenimyroides ceti]